jgi:hypothetical protein
MAESAFSPLVPLDGGHDRSVFDCGVPALNLYLRNYAWQNQKRGIVRNYVTTHGDSKGVGSLGPAPIFPYRPLRAPRVRVEITLEQLHGRGAGETEADEPVHRPLLNLGAGLPS